MTILSLINRFMVVYFSVSAAICWFTHVKFSIFAFIVGILVGLCIVQFLKYMDKIPFYARLIPYTIWNVCSKYYFAKFICQIFYGILPGVVIFLIQYTLFIALTYWEFRIMYGEHCISGIFLAYRYIFKTIFRKVSNICKENSSSCRKIGQSGK